MNIHFMNIKNNGVIHPHVFVVLSSAYPVSQAESQCPEPSIAHPDVHPVAHAADAQQQYFQNDIVKAKTKDEHENNHHMQIIISYENSFVSSLFSIMHLTSTCF